MDKSWQTCWTTSKRTCSIPYCSRTKRFTINKTCAVAKPFYFRQICSDKCRILYHKSNNSATSKMFFFAQCWHKQMVIITINKSLMKNYFVNILISGIQNYPVNITFIFRILLQQQIVNKHYLNIFFHKIVFYVVNYHSMVSVNNVNKILSI